MEAVHIELSDEGGYVGVFEVLPVKVGRQSLPSSLEKMGDCLATHARTFENSWVGDMTKLSSD